MVHIKMVSKIRKIINSIGLPLHTEDRDTAFDLAAKQ